MWDFDVQVIYRRELPGYLNGHLIVLFKNYMFETSNSLSADPGEQKTLFQNVNLEGELMQRGAAILYAIVVNTTGLSTDAGCHTY